MPTSLAAQLARIAANSTNPLDLKAQKKAHSQSILFEPNIAANQDFETLYQLCIEGFEELCLIDRRFHIFTRSIFGEQSKREERSQMTAEQNEKLDGIINHFLYLVGARLLLKPALKTVEWLVRRFRWEAPLFLSFLAKLCSEFMNSMRQHFCLRSCHTTHCRCLLRFFRSFLKLCHLQ